MDDPNGGIDEYSAATGASILSFATSVATNGDVISRLGGDSSGNIYGLGSFNNGQAAVEKFAIGANMPSAMYSSSGGGPNGFGAAPTGEIVVANTLQDQNNAVIGTSFDVWDPGKTGAPSRTITYMESNSGADAGQASFLNAFALATDGTLYAPHQAANAGSFAIDVIPPGASKPSRTISENLASVPIFPNAMAVDSAGTVYVGEWGYSTPDPDAGLFIFPSSGSESFVSSMALGIVGIDFDANGNVYVASDNATYTTMTDTAEQLSIYSPKAASLIRQFDDGAPGATGLTVGDDGTAFLVQDSNLGLHGNAPANGAVAVVRPGAMTSSVFIANQQPANVLLEDGMTERQGSNRRRVLRLSSGGVTHGGVGRRALRRR